MATTGELKNIFLAFWNLDVKEPVAVSVARDRLGDCNLARERAADVAPSTAMRRAADIVKSKTIEAKTFTCKESGLVRTQIDSLVEEDGRLRRSFVSQYELDKDGCPRHVAGQELSDFLPAFSQASSHYTGADLSKIIQAILTEDGMGAFSPRKGGGVYFVPVKPEAADLLERIGRFAESVSVRFLTYSVPDTAAQREEIAEAIAQSYREEIRTHAEAIATYTHETKTFVIDNRREAINATRSHMEKLSALMNGRYGSFCEDLNSLLFKLRDLAMEIQSRSEFQDQERRQAGGRRIVVNSGV